MVLKTLHRTIVALNRFERRFDPFFRSALDTVFRTPQATLIQFLTNLGRRDDGLMLAQERALPDEEAHIQSVIDALHEYMQRHYQPGTYQRVGQTKMHGLVRGELTVHDDLPADLRHGLFAEAKRYPVWIRFSGPGPDMPRDIDDVGFVSMALKVMGVPGPKLLDDEHRTQDLLSVCTPTFVTPDVRANAKLQQWVLQDTPLWYFADPRDPHLLDGWMQSLWTKTQSNPLGEPYFSCVPYLLGEGRAMQYAFQPKTRVIRQIPNLPFRPPADYLRDNMIKTLGQTDVEFDMTVQLQTDPFRMPIETAAVLWPASLSPHAPVATLRIPQQVFDSPQQRAFAGALSYNPWHCLPEHRPLGNQSRARLRIYEELSRYRQDMNGTPHVEPTGDEQFG